MKRNIRHSRVFVVVAIVALASLAAAVRPASAESYPQARGGWFLGFGFGGGTAGLTAGGQSSDRQGAPSGSFRVGYDLSPEIGLGLETNGWTKSEDVQGQTETDTFDMAAATFYYHPPTNGLVLRGGVGAGGAHASAKSGNTTTTSTETGFGFTLGAAYDFRIRRTFSIGPQIDYSWMTLSDFDANYVNFGLSFDWHFIGK
jgi:hypothetical protein